MLTDDYHIRTTLSLRTDKDADIHKIIQLQKDRGMTSIGFADYDSFFDSKSKNIGMVRKAIVECEPAISVNLGVESHMLEYGVASIDIQTASHFDYVLIAPNPYHLRGAALPINQHVPRRLAVHEMHMFEAAIACPITDVVVRPFVFPPNSFGLSQEKLSAFSQEVMYNLDQKRLMQQLDLASERGLGIEISPKFILYDQRHMLEFYQLCVKRNVKLMIGSDAPITTQLKELALLAPILQELGVSENQLWRPEEWRW